MTFHGILDLYSFGCYIHCTQNNLSLDMKKPSWSRLERMQRHIYPAFVHINLAQKPDIYRFASDPSVTSSVFVPRFRFFLHCVFAMALLATHVLFVCCSYVLFYKHKHYFDRMIIRITSWHLLYAVLPKPNPDIRYKVETAQEAPVPC